LLILTVLQIQSDTKEFGYIFSSIPQLFADRSKGGTQTVNRIFSGKRGVLTPVTDYLKCMFDIFSPSWKKPVGRYIT
jgi:hypothetical protein